VLGAYLSITNGAYKLFQFFSFIGASSIFIIFAYFVITD